MSISRIPLVLGDHFFKSGLNLKILLSRNLKVDECQSNLYVKLLFLISFTTSFVDDIL